MQSIYKNISGKSFYKEEKERIQALIEEPLLIQVLSHLPHLQLTPEQQEATWEVVAINLNNHSFAQSFGEDGRAENTEIPTLNGIFVKEIFNTLRQNFYKRHVLPLMGAMPPIPNGLRESLSKRTDFLLCELYEARGYDAEVLATLAKERYLETQRANFQKSLLLDEEDHQKRLDQETRDFVRKNQEQSDKIRLQVYEKELAKRNKRVDQLVSENKKLLELNHDLLSHK